MKILQLAKQALDVCIVDVGQAMVELTFHFSTDDGGVHYLTTLFKLIYDVCRRC